VKTRRWIQNESTGARRLGERFDLPEDDDPPIGAVPAADVRDLIIFLKRSGMDDLVDVAETLALEHEASTGAERRYLDNQQRDNEHARRVEQRARLFDAVARDDSRYVLFDRERQRVLGREDIDALVEGREVEREQEHVEQSVSLLGGAGMEN